MWSPYSIGTPPRIRPLYSNEGLGDRLRLVAFAERQAFHAFNEAATRFSMAPPALINAWRWVAIEEAKHESWLLKRLSDIGQEIASVPVSLNLYHSLTKCQTPESFALYVSDAEKRGKIGAEKFAEALALKDPVTAAIFARIALEEREHIALVERFFPTDISHIR
ncbi:MAG TPA: ferritin-like domain-containing protein [Bacteriovoracaceae bacterium]|nr:ferritin-like domain-containing protein [Bacteriovoracaceae bacterium]